MEACLPVAPSPAAVARIAWVNAAGGKGAKGAVPQLHQSQRKPQSPERKAMGPLPCTESRRSQLMPRIAQVGLALLRVTLIMSLVPPSSDETEHPLTHYRGIEREAWIAEVEAEYQRRFAHNTRSAVGLHAVSPEGESTVDVTDSRMFGVPITHDDPPRCGYCGREMFVLLQLRGDRLPHLWHPEGRPMFCVFACFEADCCGQFEDDRSKPEPNSRFAVRYTPVPEAPRLLQTLDRWPALRFAITEFDDIPEDDGSRERWWGLAYTEFFRQRVDVKGQIDEVLLDWFQEATATPASNSPTEGLKVGGHPWANPSSPGPGLDPRCDILLEGEALCGERMDLVLQIPPDSVVPIQRVMEYVGSPLRVVTSFRRLGYVFVCRECGEGSLRLIWN